MTIFVYGSSSNVFSKINIYLEAFDSVVALKHDFDLCSMPGEVDTFFNSIIIFNGVVTDDVTSLTMLEEFHLNLAERLSALNKIKIILISSSAVYGDYKSNFSEIDHCQPIRSYGTSKLVTEGIYRKFIGSNLIIFRLGNFIGLDSVGLRHNRSKNQLIQIKCRENGSTPLRSYVDEFVLSNAIKNCVKRTGGLPDVLNVARFVPQSMSDAAEELGMHFELKLCYLESLKDITLMTAKLENLLIGERK